MVDRKKIFISSFNFLNGKATSINERVKLSILRAMLNSVDCGYWYIETRAGY